MPIRIHNSLTQKKEDFTPLKAGSVGIYVCGPTVYDEPHIGHLRSAYAFEVIRNYFKYAGYKVRFVRNVTDVDDKIIDKAREAAPADLNAETLAVSSRYFDLYKKDLRRLGIQDPDLEPRATQYIDAMKTLIGRLIEKGCAYAAADGVYFDVNAYKAAGGPYGEVSHQDTEQMLEESGEAHAAHKKNPLDFALWKGAKEGEPSWPSPWGPGRPGWHIECSAMSLSYFGGTFDIHGGGRDLIFPHHENENAQSRAATGAKFVNTWVHHGLITVGGRKMSKSLKNFITLDTIRSSEPPFAEEVLKLTFLGTHYSAPLDYTQERVQMDRATWKKFFEFFQNARLAEKEGHKPIEKKLSDLYGLFRAAMDNDFNTPEVVTTMHQLVAEAYKKNDPAYLLTVAHAIRNFGAEVFSVNFDQDSRSKSIEPEIQDVIARRAEARRAKDYKKADLLRDALLKEKSIELRDLPDGRTTWRVRL